MLATGHSQENSARGGLERLPVAAMAATLVLAGAASFLPGHRLWGINHLAFYPVYVRVIVLALAATAFIPRVGRATRRAIGRAAETCSRSGVLANAVALAGALLSACVFWICKSSTLLLGDARLVASNFEHAFDPAYELIVSSPRIILLQEPIAKGTGLLYHFAARAALAGFGASPVDGIRVLNCALGALFVFLLLRAVLSMQEARLMAAWALLIILTSGVMQLYFGYVENYTPLIFFGSLYVLAGFTCLGSGRSGLLIAALLFLALAAFMHVQGILLTPSFALLLIWRYRSPDSRELVHVSAALAALTGLGALILAVGTGYSKHFLPVFGNQDIFGILSPSHLADMANQIMLILPFSIVAASLLYTLARGRAARASPGSPGGQAAGIEPKARLLFALMILFPCALFLFVFKPDLGMARDWDLFAIVSLGVVPLTLMALSRALAAGRRRLMETLIVPAATSCVLLSAAYIGVNADPGRSARRFEAILTYDLTRAPYAYEVLAQHYRHAGDLDRAIDTMERGIAASYNLRLMSLAAALHDEMGDYDQAVRLYKEVLERQPETEGTRRNLVLLLHRLGRREELFEVSLEGTRHHPDKPIYHYFYGLTLIDSGEVEQGIEELLTCRRLGPPPDVIARVDSVLRRLEALGYDIEGRDSPTQFRAPADSRQSPGR